MSVLVKPATRPELAPFSMSDRFRHDIAYFMSLPGEPGVPEIPSGDYWVALSKARIWLADGVMDVVSPLDSENQTEIELSEEQESWLEWMVSNEVEHIRLTNASG